MRLRHGGRLSLSPSRWPRRSAKSVERWQERRKLELGACSIREGESPRRQTRFLFLSLPAAMAVEERCNGGGSGDARRAEGKSERRTSVSPQTLAGEPALPAKPPFSVPIRRRRIDRATITITLRACYCARGPATSGAGGRGGGLDCSFCRVWNQNPKTQLASESVASPAVTCWRQTHRPIGVPARAPKGVGSNVRPPLSSHLFHTQHPH